MPPEFATLGGSAAGAAMEAGYNFAFGGSSSSGMQPMEAENVQQKIVLLMLYRLVGLSLELDQCLVLHLYS